jgi:hypothetical protein
MSEDVSIQLTQIKSHEFADSSRRMKDVRVRPRNCSCKMKSGVSKFICIAANRKMTMMSWEGFVICGLVALLWLRRFAELVNNCLNPVTRSHVRPPDRCMGLLRYIQLRCHGCEIELKDQYKRCIFGQLIEGGDVIFCSKCGN